jgi:hypothetical protein
VIHHVKDHRAALRRDPPRETLAHRYPHPLLDLFLQPAGRRRHQLAGPAVQQQDRGSIGLQGLLRPLYQRIQQRLRMKHGQRRIGDRLDIAQPFGLVRRHNQARRACSRTIVIVIDGRSLHASSSGRTLFMITHSPHRLSQRWVSNPRERAWLLKPTPAARRYYRQQSASTIWLGSWSPAAATST